MFSRKKSCSDDRNRCKYYYNDQEDSFKPDNHYYCLFIFLDFGPRVVSVILFFYIPIYMELRGGTIIFFSKSYLFSLRNLISKQKMYTIRYNSFLIVYCLYYMAHRNFLSFFFFFCSSSTLAYLVLCWT